jgi:hypothetical protein
MQLKYRLFVFWLILFVMPVQSVLPQTLGASEQQSHFLNIINPIIINPLHKASIDLQEIKVSWVNFSPALYFTLSLFDLNTNEAKLDKLIVHTPFYNLPEHYVKYGHHYRLVVAAGDASGKETSSQISFKINILPALSGLALEMDKLETVIWDNCSPDLLIARDKLVKELKQRNWRIFFTSAYRPYQFQQHYYLIVTNLKDTSLDPEDLAYLKNEKKRHGLGTVVAEPAENAPHIRGIAFDAMVQDNKGAGLNGLRFISPALLALLHQAGFKTPPLQDCVHFELDIPAQKAAEQ